jgi:hypothetical protein
VGEQRAAGVGQARPHAPGVLGEPLHHTVGDALCSSIRDDPARGLGFSLELHCGVLTDLENRGNILRAECGREGDEGRRAVRAFDRDGREEVLECSHRLILGGRVLHRE